MIYKIIPAGGNRMKKILWAVLLAVLLAGCGADTIQEPTEAPLVEVQVDYEESVIALPYAGTELVMQSVWKQEDPQSRVLLEAASLFKKQTGAVVTVRWNDEPAASVETAENVDIFQIRAVDFSAIPAEYVLDLTEMAAKADYDAKSHEALRELIMEQCGCLGAVAQVPYLGGVYYNTEILQQCGITQRPETWDDFLTLCQTLRSAGWQPLTLDQEDALAAMELHLRRSIGTEEVRRMMQKGNRWDTNMPAITAMEQVMLFVKAGNMATGTPAEYPAGQNKMAGSNSAMMVGTNADCAAVEEATLTDLRWGIFPYPGNMSSGTWMTADMLLIHRDSKYGQAAFDFLMLLVSGEFDQLRTDLTGGIPADPANESPIAGAMEAIRLVQPEPLGLMGWKQQDAAVKLWSAWYDIAGRYASVLERSK